MEGDKEYGFQVWRRGRPFYFNFKSEVESDISEWEMMRIVGIFRVGFGLIIIRDIGLIIYCLGFGHKWVSLRERREEERETVRTKGLQHLREERERTGKG